MPRRFRAPAGNSEILADPPFADVPRLVAENRRRLDRADVLVGGMPLRELRSLARREILPDVPPDVPLLVAGHQPELSHPGVWAKNFALNGLARRIGGVPLNLVVDNDTLKSTALRFPVLDGTGPGGVRLESVAFDRFVGDEPYEDRTVHDSEMFRTFTDRAAPVWVNWGVEPLLPEVWPGIVADPSPTIGGKFAAVRRAWERTWGCENRELTVRRIACGRAYGLLATHIAGDIDRFRECYNAAVRAYRRVHGIRSHSHPVPDLAADELPFWERVPGQRRRPLLRGRLPGVNTNTVRPRALTLTLFARVCLGDFFLHGIGGGKYDEVTDAIIRDYFGLEPPAYQVVSATLHLPLPAFPTTPADVLALARRERDAHWNPHRHLPADTPAVRVLVERHRQLAAAEPADAAGRKQRFRDFRAIAEELQPRVAGELDRTRETRRRADAEAAANAILTRRDFAWVLYPEATLRPFLQRFLDV
ncbi:MAG: hypothetical protein ACRC7O_14140 [Fimbriiglobus sp.]